jgi:hypothetical protein
MDDIATAQHLINTLTVELSQCGLSVDAQDVRLTVRNPGAEAGGYPAHGQILNRGMRQTVVLWPRHDDENALWWFWEWPGPERDAPAEYEPFCRGSQVGETADRIARVLAMRSTPTSATG